MVSQTTPNNELTQPEKVVRKSSRGTFTPNYKDMHLGISTQPILKGDTTSLETEDNAISYDAENDNLDESMSELCNHFEKSFEPNELKNLKYLSLVQIQINA